MVDERRERPRETDHTTVVTTDRGGSGAGTVLAVVLAILLIGLLLLLVFGGWLGGTTEEIDVPEEVGVNIDVGDSGAESPDVAVPEPETPAPGEGGNGG